MNNKKTHEEFCKELSSINPNIEVIGTYTKANETIKVKCLKCGGEWSPIANSLLHGNGCPYCCPFPQKVLVGFNDMWTTNPELAKLLFNPEDGYKYTQCSNKKVDWKCPHCNQIVKNKIINDVNKRGLSCPYCSDGISYPEKFLASMLKQLEIEFEKEKVFEWAKDKRYDYYLPKYNIIIEAHGKQHYCNTGFMKMNNRARNFSEEKLNDKIKMQLAKENHIKNYIVINAEYSDLNYIKENILNSSLNQLFDLSNIDWLQCHEYACKNLIKEACDYWENGVKNSTKISSLMGLSHTTIVNYLKQGAKLGWCDYNPQKVASINGKKNGKKRGKKVICVETGQIYESISDAARHVINGSDTHISSCCKGKRKSCGKLEDGTPLHWQYVDNL